MAQAEALTLTEVIIDLRRQLLDALEQPSSAATNTALTSIWRTCLTIHDIAQERRSTLYVQLMDRMIDAIADYNTYAEPHKLNWQAELPSIAEIEAAAG